jgi:hypothetical protein
MHHLVAYVIRQKLAGLVEHGRPGLLVSILIRKGFRPSTGLLTGEPHWRAATRLRSHLPGWAHKTAVHASAAEQGEQESNNLN